MANIREVAKLAGVSPASVSRILNNDSTYHATEETIKRVFSAAKKLNYTIPQNARSNGTSEINARTPRRIIYFFTSSSESEIIWPSSSILIMVRIIVNSSSVWWFYYSTMKESLLLKFQQILSFWENLYASVKKI